MGTVRSGGLETKVTSGASVLSPPPQKKRGGGGLVVSKWHMTKACLFTFRAEGGLCAFKRRWGEGKGRKSTDWVTTAEAKSETEYFVQVDWVGVEDANVHLPFF